MSGLVALGLALLCPLCMAVMFLMMRKHRGDGGHDGRDDDA